MRKSLFVFFIFILSFNLFGQGISKTTEKQLHESVKFYQGLDYKPYLFEPYRAEYVLRGSLVGMNFDLFDFRPISSSLKTSGRKRSAGISVFPKTSRRTSWLHLTLTAKPVCSKNLLPASAEFQANI